MRNSLLLACLMLPACLSASEPPSEKGLAGPVIYEARSWGRIMIRWQINPDGTGEIWRVTEQKDKGELRKYRLRLAGDPFRAFVTNVEDVREATRGGIKCDKDIYDLPYGSVTWDYPDAKQAYSFDSGCRSEKGDEVMDILGAATTIVETSATVEARPYAVEPGGSR